MKRYQRKWRLPDDADRSKVKLQRRDIMTWVRPDGVNAVRMAPYGNWIYDEDIKKYRRPLNDAFDVATWNSDAITVLPDTSGASAWDVGRCVSIAANLMEFPMSFRGRVRQRYPFIHYPLNDCHVNRTFQRGMTLTRDWILSEKHKDTAAHRFMMQYREHGLIHAYETCTDPKRIVFRDISNSVYFQDGSSVYGYHHWGSPTTIDLDLCYWDNMRWSYVNTVYDDIPKIDTATAKEHIRGINHKYRMKQARQLDAMLKIMETVD